MTNFKKSITELNKYSFWKYPQDHQEIMIKRLMSSRIKFHFKIDLKYNLPTVKKNLSPLLNIKTKTSYLDMSLKKKARKNILGKYEGAKFCGSHAVVGSFV